MTGRALLIVDVQNDFCEGGSLAVTGGAEVAGRVDAFVTHLTRGRRTLTMDHLVIPLDPGHMHAIDELITGVTAAAGLAPAPEASSLHLTLIAHSGLDRARVATAIAPVVAAAAPFTVHAHGYGFFTGPEPSDLSLHVPVVRSGPLDALHGGLCAALRAAGVDIAGWSAPEVWSPHITLLDRQLSPARLGAAASWLAQRHHPSWRIPIDGVAITGGWRQRHHPAALLPLGRGAEQSSKARRDRPYEGR